MSRSTFWKILCFDSLERANGNLTFNCFAFPCKCRASSPVFSWESANNIYLQECHLTMTFFLQSFWFVFHHPWERQKELAPMEQPQPWWRLRTPYGMLRVATTLRSQLPRHSEAGAPLPPAGREATKEAVMPAPKVAPLPAQIFILFRALAMACINFTTATPIGLTGGFRPVLGRKTISPPDPFRFGGFFHTCHCHGYAFSCKCWLDVFNSRIDQW